MKQCCMSYELLQQFVGSNKNIKWSPHVSVINELILEASFLNVDSLNTHRKDAKETHKYYLIPGLFMKKFPKKLVGKLELDSLV